MKDKHHEEPEELEVVVDPPPPPVSTDDQVEDDQVTQPADQLEEADGGDPASADPLDEIEDASNEDQERGPQGARGYDSEGNVRPADTRADVLVTPEDDDDTDKED